jgi:hypothetical protein
MDTKAIITKIMATGPRRVAQLTVNFMIPDLDYIAEQKFILHDAAINCPLAKSLSASIKQTVTFTFEKALRKEACRETTQANPSKLRSNKHYYLNEFKPSKLGLRRLTGTL